MIPYSCMVSSESGPGFKMGEGEEDMVKKGFKERVTHEILKDERV